MKKILTGFLAILMLSSAFSCIAAAEQLPYQVGRGYTSEFTDGTFIYYADYAGVKLSDAAAAAYPDLAAGINSWAMAMHEGAEESGNEIIEAAKADLSMGGYFYGPYFQSEGTEVLRADSRFFSVVYSGYAYTGGAHGIPYRAAACFESRTGRMVSFHELIADQDAFTGLVMNELNRLYPGLSMAEYARDIIADTENPPLFAVDNTGLTVFFGAYSLGSYAEGEQIITIPYAGNEGVFSTDLSPADDVWSAVLAKTGTYNFDLDGDGIVEQVSIYLNEDEYGVSDTVTINVNGNILSKDIEAFSSVPVVIRRPDGSTLLYLYNTGSSDWQMLECFRLEAQGAEYLGTQNAGFTAMWDGTMTYTDIPVGAEFRMNTRCSVLGTKGICANFAIGENGLPVKIDDLWTIERVIPQRVSQSFDAWGENGSSVTVPAGSAVSYIATDAESLCILRLENGSEAKVFVNRYQWPYTINGTDISEIFENIMFAG